MTLWKRTADGIRLCAVAVGVLVLGNALIQSGLPGLGQIGGALGLIGFVAGFPLLVIGGLLILGGAFGHIREIYRRRQTDA